MNRLQQVILGIGVITICSGVIFLATQSNPRTVSTTQGSVQVTNVRDPALSGSLLSYYDAAGFLVTADLQTNTTKYRREFSATPETQFLWSPTGSAVIIVDANETAVVDLETGLRSALHPGIVMPAWSSDGTRILYEFFREDVRNNSIAVSDATGGNFTTILDSQIRFEQLWWGPKGQYAILLDTTSAQPQYYRLLISSKRLEPVAAGYGTVRFSPSGARAVLDLLGEQSVGLIDLDTGSTTTLPIKTNATMTAWESETSLLAITSDRLLVRFQIMESETTEVRPLNTDEFVGLVLGVIGKQLIVLNQSEVTNLPL